ncbi:MAG: MFS transporter [Chloroflexota bacterium]|nr:MFS transporter [Chloroflexota bacterium]
MAQTRTRTGIPRTVRKNTMLLASSQAFSGAGGQMVPTLAPVLVVQMINNASLAGIGTSITGLSRLIIAYPIGRLTDAFGRRAGVVLGLLLTGCGAGIIGASAILQNFPGFLFGLLVMGLGTGAVQQLRVAAADMYPPNRRAEGLGLVLTGSLVGAVFGPILIRASELVAPGFDMEPIALAWFFVPVAVLGSITLIMQVRPDPKEIASNLQAYYPDYVPPPAVQGTPEKVSIVTFIKEYPKLTAFITMFSVQGNMNMMMAMTSLALKEHGFALSAISLSVAIHVIGMFGFSIPIGKLGDRIGRRNTMLLGVLVAAMGTWLIVATPHYWIITFGTFLVGLGWSGGNISATALYADTTPPAARGRVIGANDTFTASASIGMPIVGGVVIQTLGLQALGFFGMALMVPALFYLLRLRERYPGSYEGPGRKQPAPMDSQSGVSMLS